MKRKQLNKRAEMEGGNHSALKQIPCCFGHKGAEGSYKIWLTSEGAAFSIGKRRVNHRIRHCPRQNNMVRISLAVIQLRPERSPLLRAVIYTIHISVQMAGVSDFRRYAGAHTLAGMRAAAEHVDEVR